MTYQKFSRWDGASPEMRFWAKVDKSGECWLWTGTEIRGYGSFALHHRQTVRAHRFSYELAKGAIPEGLTIDHLCRTPRCVNPAHLEAVTQGENVRRAPTQPSSINRLKTHCPQGHEYTASNTRIWKRKRSCRECGNARRRKARAEG